ncbi:hypothetical protein EGW08_001230 [Elysia chlorotica]|uniref:Integrase catalytic domain-containing protein n=1 Tax=Elysia chlorotica TaxID=188477 RepID=A0A3S1CF57_ELYCH|nr:hypothetical protein EGW08_001230 [Elysia chlorotica]
MSRSQSQEELIRLLREQMSQQQQQMEALLALVQQSKPAITNTKFGEFDPSTELWADYWARFETFTKANAIPDERRAEIFLTNQSNAIYKLVKNWAQQQTPPRDVNNLTMAEIETYMADQFNPKRFVVGISCDASDVGIGCVLFHRYNDGSERPIANASKTLTQTQRRYSQIQKEALAIIFGLHKFHQFLYGRKFILITDHKPLIALFGPTKPIPALAANRLARWALTLSQYDYKIEYRKTADHGNADALSRLPMGADSSFDREENGADSTTICTIKLINSQMTTADPKALEKSTSTDAILTTVMKFLQHGWPKNIPDQIKPFFALRDSLTHVNGCLFYGHRVVVPTSLQSQILQILHLGHFGMQRMKQLARTAVYWPRIDTDIEDIARHCKACNEHQKLPPKQPSHPWITPDKPWSRVHIDHAINFRGHNWLVMVDAFSKYPCVHLMSSISTKATTRKLDEDFAHFGYPHAIVTDNAACFSSAEFQTWCEQRGIQHLHGAPYHPETNGAAERLVQTFKQSLKKSDLPPADALQEFLMHYRRTPLASGSSPSELLNGRQIRTKLDVIVPAQRLTPATVRREPAPARRLTKDSPCFALSYKAGRRDTWDQPW